MKNHYKLIIVITISALLIVGLTYILFVYLPEKKIQSCYNFAQEISDGNVSDNCTRLYGTTTCSLPPFIQNKLDAMLKSDKEDCINDPLQ